MRHQIHHRSGALIGSVVLALGLPLATGCAKRDAARSEPDLTDLAALVKSREYSRAITELGINRYVGEGALLRWKRDDGAALVRKLVPALIASIVAGVLVMLYFGYSLGAILGIALAVWVTWLSGVAVREQLKGKRKLSSIQRGFWGMLLGHLGVAVFTIGVTLTSIYSVEKDVSLGAGDSYALAGYTFTFNDIKQIEGPNYSGTRGIVTAATGVRGAPGSEQCGRQPPPVLGRAGMVRTEQPPPHLEDPLGDHHRLVVAPLFARHFRQGYLTPADGAEVARRLGQCQRFTLYLLGAFPLPD